MTINKLTRAFDPINKILNELMECRDEEIVEKMMLQYLIKSLSAKFRCYKFEELGESGDKNTLNVVVRTDMIEFFYYYFKIRIKGTHP